MEDIYKNILDIEWWFNGIFFIAVGLLTPLILSRFIPYIGYIFIKKPFRRMAAKRLRKIKNIRRDAVHVSYEASKSAALLAAFASCAAIYMIIVLMSIAIVTSINDVNTFLEDDAFLNFLNMSFFIVPALEIIYLKKRLFVNSLLIRRKRLRTTHKDI